MKRVIEIGTIIFSISLLAGYVVYSDQEQVQRILPAETLGREGAPATTSTNLFAPGSKSLTPLIPVRPTTKRETNAAIREMIASSSKSRAPLIAIKPLNGETLQSARPQPMPKRFSPGSKSFTVFDFQEGTKPLLKTSVKTNPPSEEVGLKPLTNALVKKTSDNPTKP